MCMKKTCFMLLISVNSQKISIGWDWFIWDLFYPNLHYNQLIGSFEDQASKDSKLTLLLSDIMGKASYPVSLL